MMRYCVAPATPVQPSLTVLPRDSTTLSTVESSDSAFVLITLVPMKCPHMGLTHERQMPHLPILNLAVATGPSVLPSYSGMMVTMYSVSDCSLDKGGLTCAGVEDGRGRSAPGEQGVEADHVLRVGLKGLQGESVALHRRRRLIPAHGKREEACLDQAETGNRHTITSIDPSCFGTHLGAHKRKKCVQLFEIPNKEDEITTGLGGKLSQFISVCALYT
ncbi:hypothetical protein EYF80_030039 [Liparis tanakae]|uniref:Uncharacterized protein n=1 Tax=Liparis tanakae TaxID=230148 RepID=A0A4Z2H1V5_9TELE|nr:hypothetical protein EYF80_030039 [Liparis tanakae]